MPQGRYDDLKTKFRKAGRNHIPKISLPIGDWVHYFIQYILAHMGIPYVYGGNNPMEGYDCSGFALDMGRYAGVTPLFDTNAQGLHDHFMKYGKLLQNPKPGSYLFFGESHTKISHVAIAIDRYVMAEAGGGDSTVKNFEDAKQANACTRVRPIKRRNDLVAIYHPNYEKIGLVF